MRYSHSLLIGGIALLASCGRTSSDDTTVVPVNDPQWASSISPLVTANCGPCHTGGNPSLPLFNSSAAFKGSKAAAELQAGSMPPAPRIISPGDKSTLLTYLAK